MITAGGRAVAGLAVAVAVAAVVGSSGCSSSDGAVALPSLSAVERSSPSVSATPSSTSTSPTSTSGATAADVEAAVRAYFAAANVAIATGDTEALRELTAPACGCLSLARSAEATFKHGSAHGAEWRLASVVSTVPESAVALASVDYVATAYDELDVDGNVKKHFPGHRNQALIQMVLVGGQWLVGNFDNTSREPL